MVLLVRPVKRQEGMHVCEVHDKHTTIRFKIATPRRRIWHKHLDLIHTHPRSLFTHTIVVVEGTGIDWEETQSQSLANSFYDNQSHSVWQQRDCDKQHVSFVWQTCTPPA